MSCSQKAGLGAGGRGAGASSEVRAGGGGGEPGPAAGQPVLGGLDATQRMEGQLGPWARAMGREVGWEKDTRTRACPAFKVPHRENCTAGDCWSADVFISWVCCFFPVLCFCSQMSIPSPLTNRASGSDFLCVLVKTQWNTCCSSFLVLSSVPLDDDLSLCKYRVCLLLMRHRKPQLEDDPPTVFLPFSIVSCCPTVLFHRDFRTSLSVSEKHLTGILVGIGLNL